MICVLLGSKAGAAYVKAAEHYMQAEDMHDAARRFNDAATAYQKTDVERMHPLNRLHFALRHMLLLPLPTSCGGTNPCGRLRFRRRL